MPVVRYGNENLELFQRCSWDASIRLPEEESSTPNRVQRAASIAYTVDTRPERPLLQLYLPNKVEYLSKSNEDRYLTCLEVNGQNSNHRRHSSGNCETTKQISNAPPPVPARLNKAPAIPERKNVAKFSLGSPFSQASPFSPPPLQNGANSPPKPDPAKLPVKLPPPPQSSHSKRAVAAAAAAAAASCGGPTTTDDAGRTPNGAHPEIKALTPLQHAALYNSLQQKSTEEGYFRFPKVGSNESFPKAATEEADCGAYSYGRRLSGKKIPPPIATCAAHTLDETLGGSSSNLCEALGKAPERQDSTLSCSDGGMSQTSSPSYLVRSLESPLLPKGKNHSTNRHSKRKFITDKLFAEINELAYPKEGKSLAPPDLEKSQSTPGGLQTVVDYQQGASMQYQHKVIRDDKNADYISRSQLKFQFVQIVINVIVLLAVAVILAGYFRAFPPVTTTVKYINHTIIRLQNVSQWPSSFYYPPHLAANDDGFYCQLLTVRFCTANHVSYNYTILPSTFISHQSEADEELGVYNAIINVRCYQLAALYLCSLFLPKCGADLKPVKPCRNLCIETSRRCGLFFKVFGLQFPRDEDCDSLPSSENPDECIGHKEMVLHDKQEELAVCHDGFKCDRTRCIPADWRCDGHIDCEDETDESNCTQCPGQLHCGDGQCIATKHICDGHPNCPWGQDERNCVRLNDKMGDVGYGIVEVFVAKDKAFKTACIGSWDSKNSPRLMCELLGYKQHNHTEFEDKALVKSVRPFNYTSKGREENKLELFRELRKCQNGQGRYPAIKATCSTYACGVRKQPIKVPTKRIVGGEPSLPGDWPFLAALLGGPKEIFYCAGVLISDQWVLSAAHCVGNFNLSHPPVDWTIQLGMTRRSSHSYYEQKLKVQRVIPHPDYNRGIAHNNDIALFQLKERVRFHDHLLPVCMPKSSTILKPGRNCSVIGWGKRADDDTSDYEPTVHVVHVPILNSTLCNNWLNYRDLKVSEGMICAGYEEGGKDACQGDSGGPLLCRYEHEPEKWFVGGIVSWGIRCAHPHLPGIYANVPHFIPWIEEQMTQFAEKRSL